MNANGARDLICAALELAIKDYRTALGGVNPFPSISAEDREKRKRKSYHLPIEEVIVGCEDFIRRWAPYIDIDAECLITKIKKEVKK